MVSYAQPARVLAVCAWLALTGACSSGDDATSSSTIAADSTEPAVTISSVTPTESTQLSDVETPTSTAPAPDLPDYDIDALLRSDEIVILNVLPPFPESGDMPFPVGMADFDLVFSPDGDWEEARQHVDIYRLHAWQVRYVLTDEQLRTMFAYLDGHGILLMLETEPLTYTQSAGCDHGESFSGVYDLEMAQRISDLGGALHAIAIEEPYHFVHKADGPGNCQWAVERIVDEVIEYMAEMREIFPGVPVGTIEPIWSSPATTPRDMEIWLDTWKERSGEAFAFLHIDPDWYRPDWPEVALGIEAVVDARDVPFGLLYNGGAEPDGESWMQFTMENVALFESEYGGTPQHVSFQSWVDQPQRALPPDDLGALTSGIVRYFGERTRIDIAATDAGVAITLTGNDDSPVADALLTVSARSLSGALGTRTVTGIVPDGITEAVVVIRANAEDAVPGPADVRLAAISYREAGGPDLVVNSDFDAGTNGWGIYGTPSGDVRVAGEGDETWLAISADRDQQVFVDGEIITVTPGAEYEFEVTFGIQDQSVTAVNVAIEFIGAERIHMDMAPPRIEVVRATTDANGLLHLLGGSLEPGSYLLAVEYTGDLDYWPTEASTPIDIE